MIIDFGHLNGVLLASLLISFDGASAMLRRYVFSLLLAGLIMAPVHAEAQAVVAYANMRVDHDTEPDHRVGTHFGTLKAGLQSTDVTFGLFNADPLNPLQITGPLTIAGPKADKFHINIQPATVIQPGQLTYFLVNFGEGDMGINDATISVPTNDSAFPTLKINVRAVGAAEAEAPTVSFYLENLKASKVKTNKKTGIITLKTQVGLTNFGTVEDGAIIRYFKSADPYLDAQDTLVHEASVKPTQAFGIPSGKEPKPKKVSAKFILGNEQAYVFAEAVVNPASGNKDIDYRNNFVMVSSPLP